MSTEPPITGAASIRRQHGRAHFRVSTLIFGLDEPPKVGTVAKVLGTEPQLLPAMNWDCGSTRRYQRRRPKGAPK